MGVRGLQTYIEHSDQAGSNISRQVSVIEMARWHSREYECRPVLVVDGMSLLRKIYGKTLEWVFGGQWRQFVSLLKNFVYRFQREGVKLIFFFDGSVCNFKRKTWASRRIQKAKEVEANFNHIKAYHSQPDDDHFQLPASIGTLARFAIRFVCGTEVYTSILEADQEMADFARNHKEVFAVLSQDTDFFIYDTKPYLSVTHLDVDSLTTVLYDRNAFARSIGLTVQQLPLFSCLIGNDAINVYQLKNFHKMICIHQNTEKPYITSLVPNVAHLINSYQWTGNPRNNSEMRTIAKHVFADELMSELLIEALEVYSLNLDNLYIVHQKQHVESSRSGISPKILDVARQRHINCVHVPPIYTLLINREYESSEVMEDPACKTLPPSAIAYRPLRQRMYAVLLGYPQDPYKYASNQYGYSPPPQVITVVKEWCAYVGNSLEQAEVISPTTCWPQGRGPSLELLWSEKSDEATNFLRMNTYLECLNTKIKIKDFHIVPTHYFALCCIINYLLLLRKMPLLERWEVNAFLAQAVSPLAQTTQSLALLQVDYVDSRAVQLASLFMRGVAAVTALLCTCGFPFPMESAMPWNYFDGKLFHHLYLQAKGGSPVESLCNNEPGALENFYKLHTLATAGTVYSYDASE